LGIGFYLVVPQRRIFPRLLPVVRGFPNIINSAIVRGQAWLYRGESFLPREMLSFNLSFQVDA